MCLFLFNTPKRKITFTNPLEDRTRAKHTNSLEETQKLKQKVEVYPLEKS
jgi:hypothetical protein